MDDDAKERKRIAAAKYRDAHRDELRAYGRQHRAENYARKRASEIASRIKNRDAYLAYQKAYQTSRRTRLRLALLEKFGMACVRCGYDTDWRALQIDQVNGLGRKHRESFASMTAFYEHLLHEGPSDLYQILCANCNAIKRVELNEQRWRYAKEEQCGSEASESNPA